MSSKEHQDVILYSRLGQGRDGRGQSQRKVGCVAKDLGDEVERIHDGADVSSRGMEDGRPKVLQSSKGILDLRNPA